MITPDATVAKGQTESLADQVGQLNQTIELTDPDIKASAFDRTVNRVVEFVGVAVLGTVAVLVFVNATGRYLMNAPVIWAEELVIALIPWLAMTGVFLSVRRRELIRLGYYSFGLPPNIRSAVGVFVGILSSATFVLVAFYSFEYLSLFGRDTTTYLKLPTGWFSAAMVIGAAGAAIAFLINTYLDFKARNAQAGASK
jgi:TRAP-type C4-dicarboxylate transport system permease small subunit